MKVFRFLAAGIMAAVMFASCGNSKPQIEGITKGEIDTVSYAIGMSFGEMIKGANVDNLNYGKVMEGMKAMMNGEETKITPQEVGMIINDHMMKVQMAVQKQKEKEQADFMATNANVEGVQQTESGLQYRIAEPGNDIRPTEKDTVEVHYKGTLLNGTVFDSSYDRGESATFALNRVIPGWTEGMQLVGEGGKVTLWIPYELGYGPRQMSADLPAYSTLIFEVELIKVKKFVEKQDKKGKK